MMHALKFGIPLYPHVLGGALSTMIDKLFITAMLTLSELGIYAIGFAIGSIIKSLEGAIYMAYQPWLFKMLSTQECSDSKIVQSGYAVFIFLLFASLILIVMSNLF